MDPQSSGPRGVLLLPTQARAIRHGAHLLRGGGEGALEELLGCVIDDAEVAEAARAWERGVDELELRVAKLEKEIAALKRAQKPASGS